MPKTIIKRDGKEVPFDLTKIREAVRKASEATANETMTILDLDHIASSVRDTMDRRKSYHVEEIQDLVEETLISKGFTKTAKAYIIYRSEHAKIRQAESSLMDIYDTLTKEAAKDADIKRENANIDGDTAMGVMLKYGSEGAKFFIDNYILPKEISAAHMNGDIHIHDKDFYMLTETCCQIDLLKLFKDGFSTGHGFLREPNSITSYSALACIAIQANQNEMHGGQSVPNFDFCMAPGVAKTFTKEYIKAFANFMETKHGFMKLAMIERLEGVKVSMGDHKLIPDILRHIPAMIHISEYEVAGAHAHAFYEAKNQTEKLTYQAMEALVHNLNTMNSRAGAQVPFSSLNYGTDTSVEGRLVIKSILLATQAGLGNGETPIFPVQIFKVKEGVNYDEGDPNYDLFKLAMETSAKRLFPNFSFLDAPFNLQYYSPDDYDTEVAYMGCRTRVMGNVYDKGRERTCGRGNLSFTTINLPRLAIEAKGNGGDFFRMLNDRIDLVFKQLMHRLKIQGSKKVRNYPFLMGNGIWLDSDKLDWDDSVADVIKHGTLTLGFIGLAETLVALIGKHHGQSEAAQSLGLEIIRHMRERCDAESTKYGLNFTLIATPAEGISGRFVKIDRDRYGIIKGVTDRDYYTNSFHVPVYYPIKAFKKISIEAPYHALTNAGHISYVELDGDPSKNLGAFESIIRFMHDAGIGYGSINHPVDRDPVCGYTGIINDVCPRCGRREGESVSVEKLKELRRKYPDMPKIKCCS